MTIQVEEAPYVKGYTKVEIVDEHSEYGPLVTRSLFINGTRIGWIAEDGLRIDGITNRDGAVKLALELFPDEIIIRGSRQAHPVADAGTQGQD